MSNPRIVLDVWKQTACTMGNVEQQQQNMGIAFAQNVSTDGLVTFVTKDQCYDFVSKRECDPSQMTGPFRPPANFRGLDMNVQDLHNETECQSACSKYATVNDVTGCCYSFTGGSPVCQFFIGVTGPLKQNKQTIFAKQKATICVKSDMITTTTMPTTTMPIPNPPFNCTITTSGCAAPYRDDNGQMVYDSSCNTDNFTRKRNCNPVNAINVLNCNSVDSDKDLCISACEAKAQELDQEGCCFTFQGNKKTCQFHAGSTMQVKNGWKYGYATECYRMTTRATTATSTTSTTVTLPTTKAPDCTVVNPITRLSP